MESMWCCLNGSSSLPSPPDIPAASPPPPLSRARRDILGEVTHRVGEARKLWSDCSASSMSEAGPVEFPSMAQSKWRLASSRDAAAAERGECSRGEKMC